MAENDEDCDLVVMVFWCASYCIVDGCGYDGGFDYGNRDTHVGFFLLKTLNGDKCDNERNDVNETI